MAAARLMARVGALTDTGLQREHNEDRCLVQELGRPPTDGGLPEVVDLSTRGLLLAVCDGMGGAVAGEVASGIAVQALAERAEALEQGHTDCEALAAWLVESVQEANLRTLRRCQEESQLQGMGSTLTSVVLAGDIMVLAHVGDSRGYHLRRSRLRRLTLDQSYVGRLVAMGRITEEEARKHPQKNLLLEAIGAGPDLDIDRLTVPLRPDDKVLLCSDGLSNFVSEDEIQQALEEATDPHQQCAALVEMANSRGGDDNITVVVAHVA